MNIRMSIAALALCLSSGLAFADTTAPAAAPAAKPAATKPAAAAPAAKPAAKPAAAKCKANQTMVDGKCQDKKAG
jgi:hypothetical protein